MRHLGVDGTEQPAPRRTKTLDGMPAAPRLPGELAPTLPAQNPLRKQTWRIPTPPSAVALARRSEPPDAEPLPPPSQDPDEASREALRRRAEAAEAKAAELERRERVREETASPNTFPPKVESAPVIVTPSAPPDAAIGKSLRYLAGRLWPLFVAAAGIGGGVTAVAKPTADPAKADATLAHLEELARKVDRVDFKVNGLLDREPQLTEFVECLYEQQADYFEQLLPSQQRLVTGSLQRTWVDRCRTRKPKR